MEQGKKENTIKIVKKMQKQGIDIKMISQITGLTEEEIKKLE